MISLIPFGGSGPGGIGGTITEGINFQGPGDPLAGVLVILFDNNMNPIGYTYTNALGVYNFGNLPYGTYFIYIEGVGLTTTFTQVVLNAANPIANLVDFELSNGQVIFTNTEQLEAIQKFQVFPNPTDKELTIQLEITKPLENTTIKVFSLTGQKMLEQSADIPAGTYQTQLSVEKWAAGMYVVQVIHQDGVVVKTFVKK